ncbi:MAG: hypothetical protein FJY60_03270 [Betaproteobacteria bacterium]|nr:hypothetical protein [Betaproteobacteria bacterium]
MSDAAGLPKIDLMGGRFHIFQRLNSSYWWMGFHHKGKYIRESTKEKSESHAKQVAESWYLKKLSEIQSGVIVTSTKTFISSARVALKSYEEAVLRGERSQETLKGIETVLKSRILPFFGRMPIESITNQNWFEFKDEMYKKYPTIKRGTLHQYKNALRVVLNDAYQRGTIKSLPVFKDTYSTTKIDAPRPWFNFKEYRLLQDGIKRHIKYLEETKPRWVPAAEELYDYVIFATNTGMRVSEMSNVRFCDVEVQEELVPPEKIKQFLIIRNIKGKRGAGTCKSYYGAYAAYERIIKRKNIKYPQHSREKLFGEHHRDMFNTILEEVDLKYSKTQPPARRDFVSLRATYICFRLLNQADIFEIATNCRTSPQMIRDSYARYLGGELMPNINRTKGKIDGWDR